MSKNRDKKESNTEFLKNTTAGRPLAAPPAWLRNSYAAHAANLDQHVNAKPTGGISQAQPFNLRYTPISINDDFSQRSIQTAPLRPSGNAAPSAENNIQPTVQASGIPVSDAEDLIAQWQAFIQSSGTYEDVFKQINDINTRYRSNEGLLNQLKNNNTSEETAQKIRDIEKEQDQLRTQLSELNIRREDMESLKAQIDIQLQSSEAIRADIYAQMKEVNTEYTANEGLLYQLKNNNAPAETIRELEQKRELLGKQLQELNIRREQITDNVNNIIAFRNLLYPEPPDQLENQEDQDAVVSNDQPDQPNFFAEDQNDNISIKNDAQEESIQDKIIRILNSPLTIEDASLTDSLSYIDDYLNEISEITSMGITLRGHLRNATDYNSIIRDLNKKKSEFIRLKKEYELQKEDIIGQMSVIWDEVKNKFTELLGFKNYYNENLIANNKHEFYENHFNQLLTNWNALWSQYSSEYKKLGDLVGWQAVNLPTYEELQSPDNILTNATIDNISAIGNSIFRYYTEHPDEAVKADSSGTDEIPDINTYVAELNELQQADSESEITQKAQYLKDSMPYHGTYAVAIKMAETRSPLDAEIRTKERILLANLDTLFNIYKINGNEELNINVVWLLSETGDQGKSILLEQKPEENKVTILDPSGTIRTVYSFEVSYIPNNNAELANYMKNSLDPEYHHTFWYEIPFLAIESGGLKIANSITGLAAFFTEGPLNLDMSETRENIAIMLADYDQEAGQAGKTAKIVYDIGSEVLPTTLKVAADYFAPGSSVLLSIGENYNEGMLLMESEPNAVIKAQAYAFATGALEYGFSELLYAPMAQGIIKQVTGDIIMNYGVKSYDEFISYALEGIMSPSQDRLYSLMGQAIAGPDSKDLSEKELKGSIFGYMMQSIAEGDSDMITFMERKMSEKTPWTEKDLTFVINKMTGQTGNQQTIDPSTLTPYTSPADYDAVNTFEEIAATDTVQIASDGSLIGSNFVLDTNALDSHTQNALEVSAIPQTTTSSVPSSEAEPFLDKLEIGDILKTVHSGTREPVGADSDQVYFSNKYDQLVGIPQSVFQTIEASGFKLFAIDDGSLAITSGNEIVGFIYPGDRYQIPSA